MVNNLGILLFEEAIWARLEWPSVVRLDNEHALVKLYFKVFFDFAS
jgi:hypothetical protein